jgi:hypothetical protein
LFGIGVPVKNFPVGVEMTKRPLSNIAQIASAIVGAVALLGISLQLYLTSKNAQQASARQVYMSYSEASLRYPKLAWPDYEKMKAALDQTDFNQYKTYVSHMLFAYDEILRINDEPEWHDTFDYDLSFHLQYICDENDPRFYKMFYKRTRDLLEQEKKAHCGTPKN